MKVLIKQATIISSPSPFHGQVKDILISGGCIREIADNIAETADQIITSSNLHVSIGWMDLFANFGDPGFEHKETLQSGADAAAAGGFTDVMLLPNTSPSVSNKSAVEYIKQKASSLPITIHPIASVTKKAEGKELTEMYDMFNSGAIAFGDGINSIQSPGVLLKALQYVLPLEAVIIQVPEDKSLSEHGLMNEGIVSTQLGLPGKPAIAEEIMITRDIALLKYTQSKLHITGVSTKNGIELIRIAKQEGLKLTCSVTPAHLWFCDKDLENYDSNLKINPPLRTSEDRAALQSALKEGLIDCIASHHMPQHWDDKTCEFEYAQNGMTGLETVFGVANSFVKDIDFLVEKLTVAPRAIFGIAIPEIKLSSPACLTLFDPLESYVFEEMHIQSISKNNAFVGKKLTGKVIGIINKDKISINQS